MRSSHSMELEPLKDLYIHELKDLHSAEKQLTKALPKMAKAATNESLADGFRLHLDQTEEHVNRLEQILESHKESTRGPKCKGMEGLIEEGSEMIEVDAEDEVRDAGLISAAQRVEHYEIAGYGCARTYADLIGDTQGAKLLQQTLDEEGATDKKLTELAHIGPFLQKQIRRWIRQKRHPRPPPPLRKEFRTLTESRLRLARAPSWGTRLRGDLQMHTNWSDGSGEIREMADAAVARGYEFIAITDHSKGLSIANGINEGKLKKQ